MGSMRKKRKGSDAEECSPCDSRSSVSNVRAHCSLEDWARLKKRCKEDVGTVDKPGIATAPPFGASSSILPGRGLKRKIACIDASLQLGRKNKIHNYYDFGATIGRGKFGSVWSCRAKASGMEYACKTLKKGGEIVHREVEIMQHLSGHPGIVTLQAAYEDKESFYLVMELCSGGRLVDQMVKGRSSERLAANLLKDLLLVIKYCHDMGVVHRDIKPENILLTSTGKLKLADFGLAMRVAQGQKMTGLAGSPAYVAPEVLSGCYSEKVDIWSAGVLLHALLVGFLPFRGKSLDSVNEAIKTSELDFNGGQWEAVSRPARSLLERMLTRDVSNRMTADEILRHPWILLHTEGTFLRTTPVKPRLRNPAGSLPHGSRMSDKTHSLPKGSCPSPSSSASSSSKVSGRKDEEYCLVDALAEAISNIRISEPKRIRVCGPVMQQHSSGMAAQALCKAF